MRSDEVRYGVIKMMIKAFVVEKKREWMKSAYIRNTRKGAYTMDISQMIIGK